MLNYLDEKGVDKNYDERMFDNDMRVTNALNKIKKKNIVMSADEKLRMISVFDAVKKFC